MTVFNFVHVKRGDAGEYNASLLSEYLDSETAVKTRIKVIFSVATVGAALIAWIVASDQADKTFSIRPVLEVYPAWFVIFVVALLVLLFLAAALFAVAMVAASRLPVSTSKRRKFTPAWLDKLDYASLETRSADEWKKFLELRIAYRTSVLNAFDSSLSLLAFLASGALAICFMLLVVDFFVGK